MRMTAVPISSGDNTLSRLLKKKKKKIGAIIIIGRPWPLVVSLNLSGSEQSSPVTVVHPWLLVALTFI